MTKSKMKNGILYLVVFILVTAATSGQFVMPGFPADICPSGFSLHGSSCYRFVNMRASWPEAWTYCSVMSSVPVAIESAEENTMLTDLVANSISSDGNTTDSSLRRIWTSGTNLQGNMQWRGASTRKVSFTAWSPGEPILASQNDVYCVMKLDSKWYADDCSHRRNFVCEKEIDGIAMPMPPKVDPQKHADLDGQKTTPTINFG